MSSSAPHRHMRDTKWHKIRQFSINSEYFSTFGACMVPVDGTYTQTQLDVLPFRGPRRNLFSDYKIESLSEADLTRYPCRNRSPIQTSFPKQLCFKRSPMTHHLAELSSEHKARFSAQRSTVGTHVLILRPDSMFFLDNCALVEISPPPPLFN